MIAGKALNVNAVIKRRTPIMYVHFTLQPKSEIEQHVPSEYNAFAYVVNGQEDYLDLIKTVRPGDRW